MFDAKLMEARRRRAVEIGLMEGPLTPGRYALLRDHLRAHGYEEEYQWAMNLQCPQDIDEFAHEAAWVILNSGMKNQVAEGIWKRVRPLLEAGKPVSGAGVYGHAGKCQAIDRIWNDRKDIFARFQVLRTDAERVQFCDDLPYIGPITCYHLAKNWGVDCAKPDRHMARLAALHGTTTADLCEALAGVMGERVTMVDTVLWRSCNLKLIQPIDGRLEVARRVLPEWDAVPALEAHLEGEFLGYRGTATRGQTTKPLSGVSVKRKRGCRG
jgi:hypothetical protein